MTTFWLHEVARTRYWQDRVRLGMKSVANEVLSEDDAKWAAGTSYGENVFLEIDITGTLYWFEVTTAGTSHASTEPTWGTSAPNKGDTLTDNTVTWTNRGVRTNSRKTLATNVLLEQNVNFVSFAINIMDNATIASEVNGVGANQSAETVSDSNIEFACKEQWHAWSGE